MELCGDFSRMLPRLRQGRLQQELLVKAARIKGAEAPTAVDCTAGLGEDSLLLAAAGFTVTLFERDQTIAALLADALERAAADPRLAEAVGRMTLVADDSIASYTLPEPPTMPPGPDVSRAHQERREEESSSSSTISSSHARGKRPSWRQALAAQPRKVVIKRPAKGALLAGMKPSYSVAGKAVRYDVLVPPRP